MLISHETPVSLLPYSWGYNSYDYALVHLLPENQKYRDFYFKSVEYGRHVLLDTSVFELGESFNPEEYAQWVKELKPTEYIIPDVLEDCQKTQDSMDSFLENYKDLPGKKIGVVQGKTLDELIQCYRHVSPKVDKVAISFDYSYYLDSYTDDLNVVVPDYIKPLQRNKWFKFAIGRVKLMLDLQKHGVLEYKPHHLLGASVPWEFSLYRYNCLLPYIESIDTSNPIVAGILGKRYEPNYGLEEKWSVKLVDFIDCELTEDQIYNSFWNINEFKKICDV